MSSAGSRSGASPGPPPPDSRTLEQRIRDDLVLLFNAASVPWIQFEIATLGALAELNSEVAQAWGAQMRQNEDDAMDVDDADDGNGGGGSNNNNDDDDDDDDDDLGSIHVNTNTSNNDGDYNDNDDGNNGNDDSNSDGNVNVNVSGPGLGPGPGPSSFGGSGGGGGNNGHDGRPRYYCSFPGCGKSYQAKRTRTRHIKDKHPNQPIPPFNDP
ncbi:hypothetical protein CTA2_10633 [Colletotrichum tanaceti]|uniref:C2H2-type domain-containing protein n=1 Tax=Colletotrichum tanaceti TaxID=1306861 RepID=A0A4U6XRK6_9PEZI|nr:hypothetical protein CTA2_10633 [Colletotrichum tanaceti]TKW58349.1 hypothetical protein CTA1_5193 [Colletotrichum tanaceti]